MSNDQAMREGNLERPTGEASAGEGYVSSACPVCGANVELYESVSFDRTDSLWIGTCPE
jgi:hypothetical protein